MSGKYEVCMSQKVQNIKWYLYLCLYVCMYVSVCINICVCVWYAKYKISIFGILCQINQKVQNTKMVYVCVCVYMCLCVSLFLCVWCAIYKLSIFGMFAK